MLPSAPRVMIASISMISSVYLHFYDCMKDCAYIPNNSTEVYSVERADAFVLLLLLVNREDIRAMTDYYQKFWLSLSQS